MKDIELSDFSQGALKGIRVIDFSRYIAGPYCAALLGYLGAEVIRVEKPTGGEDRFVTPIHDGSSSLLFMTGFGKKALTLDLKAVEAKEIIKRLVTTADIVVANMPPKVLKKLGLDYESLKSIKRDIILTTQTCFGHEGPWSDFNGFDGIAQVMSGSAFMSGTEDEPRRCATPYVDYTTAIFGAFGTLAALRQRDEFGAGQHVQASLLGSAIGAFSGAIIEQEALKTNRRPEGNRGQTSAPTNIFKTLDGSIITQVVGNGLFGRLAVVLGKPEWETDKRFQTDVLRAEHRHFICDVVSDWAADLRTDEAVQILSAAGVPSGPVLGISEVANHPQVEAMNFLQNVEYASSKNISPAVRVPLDFSNYAPVLEGPPQIGEHSEETLLEIGYTCLEIENFKINGVI